MELVTNTNMDEECKGQIDRALAAVLEVFQGQAGDYDPDTKMFLRKGHPNETFPACQFGRTITVQDDQTGEQDEIQVVVAVGVGGGAQFVLNAMQCAAEAQKMMASLMSKLEAAEDEAILEMAKKNKA